MPNRIKFYMIYWVLFLNISVAQAQKITGKVVSQDDQKPMGFVYVFLNNTQKGTTTDEDGNFELNGLSAGNYELLASYVGYKKYFQAIQLTDQNLDIRIELVPQSVDLQEVVITEDKNWKYNYETFLKGFIGNTPNSTQCKISNPDVLRIVFDADSAILTVKSDDFLIIENQALGYRIKYLLEDFRLDFKQNYQSYWGFAFFEEMKPKNTRQAEKWKKNRLEAFLGSTQHFMRALLKQNYEAEGFLVRKLRRIPNPNRQPESVIRRSIKSLLAQGYAMNTDTLQYWMQESRKPKILELLNPNLLPPDSIRVRQDSLTLLKFADCLQIVYQNEKESYEYLQQNRRDASKRGFQTSLIYLIEPYAIIEPNGVLRNPLAVIVEGYWGWQEKIAEILPVDYVKD